METLQRTANRGSISTGYDIDNSLKLESDNSEFLTQTIGTGNRRTATYSFWIKRTELGSTQQVAGISPIASETVRAMFVTDALTVETGVGGDNNTLTTNRLFRDTSAWYHIVVGIDTTQATEANRVKVYVNGVQETSFSTATYPAQDTDLTIGLSGNTWRYGAYDASNYKTNGYIAEAHYIDAQQLAPTEFGEFDEDSGIWKPIAYAGAYGSQGHYLDFKDSADLGANAEGNDVDFTLNNITSADQATDTPTNNFATLNPLFKYPSSQVIKEGATQVTRTSGTGLNKTFLSTIGVSGGKWYAEFKPIASSIYVVGIVPDSTSSTVAFDGNYIGNSAFPSSIGYYSDTGVKIVAPSGGSSYGDSYTTNDIIGIALDMDNSKLYFSKNGTWQNSGDPTSGATGTGSIALTVDETTFMAFSYDTSGDMQVNFGGYHANSLASAASDANGYGTFEYAPPTGYYALCTKNLAEFG
jgi:hypothetical protein